MSPSRRHDLLAEALPRLRGSGPLESPEAERERLVRSHAGLQPGLPLRMAPGLGLRFSVREEPLRGVGGTGSTAYVLTPRGPRSTTTGTLYYVHGGGFVGPLDAAHVRYAARLGQAHGLRVVLPDYPLAPEHDWRDSHEAIVEDVARYAAQGPVLLAGDSAGGNIALAAALTLRDRRGPQAARMLLLSPWVDLSESTPETPGKTEVDTWLSLGKLRAYAEWWAGPGGDELSLPELSPALGELDGLPPTLMFCGTRDLLQPGCRLLADRGKDADWSLTYVEEPDLIHVYPLMPGLPEARRAWRQTQAFLR